jgi:hypothetical protein
MFRIHLVSCCVEEKHSRSHREKITHVSRDKLRNKGHHLNIIKNQTYLFMIFISLFFFLEKRKKRKIFCNHVLLWRTIGIPFTIVQGGEKITRPAGAGRLAAIPAASRGGRKIEVYKYVHNNDRMRGWKKEK